MTTHNHIYFDHVGATSMDEHVLLAMFPYFTWHYGNASSVRTVSQEARYVLDDSRVAKCLTAATAKSSSPGDGRIGTIGEPLSLSAGSSTVVAEISAAGGGRRR